MCRTSVGSPDTWRLPDRGLLPRSPLGGSVASGRCRRHRDLRERRLGTLSRVGGAGPKRQAWLGPAPVSGSSHPRSKRSPYPEGSDRAPRCHAPWGEFWRRLDVCRSSCRTFLSPVELRWRQPPAAPGGIATRSNRFAGEIYSPYLPQVSGSGSNTTHLDWEQLWPFTDRKSTRLNSSHANI